MQDGGAGRGAGRVTGSNLRPCLGPWFWAPRIAANRGSSQVDQPGGSSGDGVAIEPVGQSSHADGGGMWLAPSIHPSIHRLAIPRGWARPAAHLPHSSPLLLLLLPLISPPPPTTTTTTGPGNPSRSVNRPGRVTHPGAREPSRQGNPPRARERSRPGNPTAHAWRREMPIPVLGGCGGKPWDRDWRGHPAGTGRHRSPGIGWKQSRWEWVGVIRMGSGVHPHGASGTGRAGRAGGVSLMMGRDLVGSSPRRRGGSSVPRARSVTPLRKGGVAGVRTTSPARPPTLRTHRTHRTRCTPAAPNQPNQPNQPTPPTFDRPEDRHRTPHPECSHSPPATGKKKHFLLKITYESFPATVEADRTRWVYEWGGCEAARESRRNPFPSTFPSAPTPPPPFNAPHPLVTEPMCSRLSKLDLRRPLEGASNHIPPACGRSSELDPRQQPISGRDLFGGVPRCRPKGGERCSWSRLTRQS